MPLQLLLTLPHFQHPCFFPDLTSKVQAFTTSYCRRSSFFQQPKPIPVSVTRFKPFHSQDLTGALCNLTSQCSTCVQPRAGFSPDLWEGVAVPLPCRDLLLHGMTSRAKLLLPSQALQAPSSPCTDFIRPVLPLHPWRPARAEFMAKSHRKCERDSPASGEDIFAWAWSVRTFCSPLHVLSVKRNVRWSKQTSLIIQNLLITQRHCHFIQV